MSTPSRDTTSGRAYLDLQARARKEGRPTDELLVLYVLERFLYRLSRSRHRNRLVLKGGMLLAAFEERRATAEVDLLAQNVTNDVDTISDVVRDVLQIDADDGVVYQPGELRGEVIRDADLYTGVRITVPASVARARHPLRVDVNVGDPVHPEPVEISYPALLGEPFLVVGYPLETVLAEKIVTMVDRGDATTRERDFADVFVLTRRQGIDASELAASMQATAAHRGSDLRPLRDVLTTLGTERQAAWERFVTRSGLGDAVPDNFEEAIAAFAEFADPILAREVVEGEWDPAASTWRRWRPSGLSVTSRQSRVPRPPSVGGPASRAITPV